MKEIKQVAELCAILGKNNIPYGFANLSNPDGIGVTTDDYQGAKTAIKYLADHGAKKILFLTHQYRGTEYLQKRGSGYLDAMREFLPDVKAESVCLGNSLDAGIVEKIRSVLEKKKPDALFCAGDDIAMRAESAILNLKLRIPEDIQVIGYGNLQMGQFAPVLLSTVDQDYERMGKLVVQGILSKGNTKRSQYLPVKLIIRESTKKENES